MDYETVFSRLNRARVRYLVVGAVALGLHGIQRATADLDLMIDLEPGNLQRALRAILGLGLRPHVPVEPMDFSDPGLRASWIREKGMLVFPWYHPKDAHFHLDVFVKYPIPFARAYARRKPVRVGNLRIPVVALPDLLKMKRLAGRDKDKEDIRRLQALGRR